MSPSEAADVDTWSITKLEAATASRANSSRPSSWFASSARYAVTAPWIACASEPLSSSSVTGFHSPAGYVSNAANSLSRQASSQIASPAA